MLFKMYTCIKCLSLLLQVFVEWFTKLHLDRMSPVRKRGAGYQLQLFSSPKNVPQHQRKILSVVCMCVCALLYVCACMYEGFKAHSISRLCSNTSSNSGTEPSSFFDNKCHFNRFISFLLYNLTTH